MLFGQSYAAEHPNRIVITVSSEATVRSTRLGDGGLRNRPFHVGIPGRQPITAALTDAASSKVDQPPLAGLRSLQ
jgi:hypothetical protein